MEETIEFEEIEALGISREAYDEILNIIGRIPTMEEISTLLAMWESNGKQQSLYGWLRGQKHSVERNDYLYEGTANHRNIREPRVKECLDIASQLSHNFHTSPSLHNLNTGLLLYLVGNINTEFADSEYARRYLHLVDEPMASEGHSEDCQYIDLILTSLKSNDLLTNHFPVTTGGLFFSLIRFSFPLGYDILCPREVRLDAFLFGEESGRYLAAVEETHDDLFLLKLDEARLNCCFLGRTTKNRILIDGYDFGPVKRYIQ